MTNPRKSKRYRKTRRGGNGCKLNTETPFEGKQMGGGLNFSEIEPKLEGSLLEEPKLIGGYKKRRRTAKRVRRGGSSLGGMFGGMSSFTDTINSLFDTKF